MSRNMAYLLIQWSIFVLIPPLNRRMRARITASCVNALGYLGNRLHMLTFVEVEGGVRVISFRKANPREQASYAKMQHI